MIVDVLLMFGGGASAGDQQQSADPARETPAFLLRECDGTAMK